MRRQPVRAPVAAWVGAPGSLSARLARAHPPFSVRVLQQGRAPAWPGEHDSLDLPAHTPLLAREVILCGDGAPLVFARSVTSIQAAHGAWRAIQGLGTRPLAQLLFSRSEIRRTPLQWQWLSLSDPSARAISRKWQEATDQPLPGRGLWMRHSVFHRAGQALRVAECFLPTLVESWPRTRREYTASIGRPVEGPGFDKLSQNGGLYSVHPELVEGQGGSALGFDRLSPNGEALARVL